VRRVALTLRAEAVEDVLDALMPLLPQGVYQRELDRERAEVAFYGDAPGGAELDALAGDALLAREEEDVPGGREERRRRAGRAWEVAGRLRVRSPADPPGAGGLEEIVIEPTTGAFGTGAHPTTRMSLALLLELEPGGGFADLGCGAGVLAIAAARLGWDPVYAVDVEGRAVEAVRRNAELNGVPVHAVQADLREAPPPPATTLAANLPFAVHEHVARRLDAGTAHVIASGIVDGRAAAAGELYAAAGLVERARLSEHGWSTLWLARP
jgi:ribosomal protein L11 methyltransferase